MMESEPQDISGTLQVVGSSHVAEGGFFFFVGSSDLINIIRGIGKIAETIVR